MKDHAANRRRQKLVVGVPRYDLEGLLYDGERLECGLCGRWFIGLAHHIALGHDDITPDEYRAKFNLNRTQPLVTPQYSDSHIKCVTRLEHPNRNFKLPHLHQESMRKQGRDSISTSSRHRTYKNSPKIPNTPKRLAALVVNLAKANLSLISTQPCCYCGKPTTGRRSHGRICCPDCHKIRGRLWYHSHPESREKSKIVSAKYRASHLEQKRAYDRERARMKYRLQHSLPVEAPIEKRYSHLAKVSLQ